MIDTTERLCTLALLKAPNLGPVMVRHLIQKLGSAQAILKEHPMRLSKIHGMGKARVQGLEPSKLLALAEKELLYAQDQGISMFDFRENDYPQALLNCHDHPLVLFQKGELRFDGRRIISIVGTRAATNRGVRFCQQLMEAIKVYDPIVVSGLAYGIDIAAHVAALEQGLETVACLAHGLQRIYPTAHSSAANRIKGQGCLLSEFGYKDPFDRPNFISRNRIIAGLSPATLVVESASKGGSLITADLAQSYHREVYAVPGRPSDTYSAGCNRLIRTHVAQLVDDPMDLIEMLGWEDSAVLPRSSSIDITSLDPAQQQVIAHLREGKKTLDQLANACGKSTAFLSGILFDLEMKQLVQRCSGYSYELIQ